MKRILYSSDMHGNEVQYRKLIDYAIESSVDALIIGGDLAPKAFQSKHFVTGQREFFKDRLPQIFSKLVCERPECNVFLMMGNDDCAFNLDMLESYEPNLYRIIHGKRFSLTDEIDLIGYSYVPITPFGIKDWEKFDLSDPPDELKMRYAGRKRANYRLDGVKSRRNGWEQFEFDQGDEKKDSIQRDLGDDIFTKNPMKTIYAVHTPPDGTNLDQIYAGAHVGSFAVRLFIEQHQPYLTLHGHVHETVAVSGNYKDQIGNTLCLTSGNHDVGEKVAVLVFNVDDPRRVRRLVL